MDALEDTGLTPASPHGFGAGETITFRVTEGPVCADGLNWWRVRGPVNFNPGWIAEKESPTGRYLIFPVPPDPETLCADPINLTIGERVPVVSGGLRVRAEGPFSRARSRPPVPPLP